MMVATTEKTKLPTTLVEFSIQTKSCLCDSQDIQTVILTFSYQCNISKIDSCHISNGFDDCINGYT